MKQYSFLRAFLCLCLSLILVLPIIGCRPLSQPEDVPSNTAVPDDTYESSYKLYEVGVDIPAGEYFVVCNDGSSDNLKYGSMTVSSDGSDFSDKIIAYVAFINYCYVTVYDGEFLKVPADYSILPSSEGFFKDDQDVWGEGMYKVGTDIPAGIYLLKSASWENSSYVTISSDSRHQLSSIINIEEITYEMYVSVEDGQYIEFSNAYMIKRPQN